MEALTLEEAAFVAAVEEGLRLAERDRDAAFRRLQAADYELDHAALAALEAGRPEVAARYWRRVLELRHRLERRMSPVGLAKAYDNLGIAVRDSGSPLDAIALHGQAVELLHPAPSEFRADLAIALSNLSRVLRMAGDLTEARTVLLEAEAILADLEPVSSNRALAWRDLGQIAAAAGDIGESVHLLERAAEMLSQVAPGALETFKATADFLHMKAVDGDWSVLPRLRETAEAMERHGYRGPALAGVHRHLADAMLLRGQEMDEMTGHGVVALSFLQMALQHAPDDLAVLVLLGSLEAQAGLHEEARPRLEAAVRRAREIGDLWLASQASQALALTADADGAIAHLEDAIEAIEQWRRGQGGGDFGERAFATVQSPYPALIAAYVSRGADGDHDRAFGIAERMRGRSLAARLAYLEGPDDERRTQLLDREHALRVALARADESPHVLRARHAAVEAELYRLEEPAPLELDDVQRRLAPDELLLEYAFTPDGLVLWAVRVDRAECVSGPPVGEELARVIAALQGPQRVVRGWRPEPTAPAASLTDALAPLSEALLGRLGAECWEDVERLLVVADGLAHLLPFELLTPPGDEARDVCERFPVTYMPSASIGLRLREHWRPRDRFDLAFAGFGDPVYEPGIAPLPWSGAEVEAIARLFGRRGVAFVGPAATELRVRSEAPAARFVSIATHGLLDDHHPLRSGLLLSPPTAEELEVDPTLNSFLDVQEMGLLRLRAELVVCSGCETGRGELRGGEGVVGLARAVLAAGARNALVSLWAVPDEGTATFMADVYEHLDAGTPADWAVHEARLAARRRGEPAALWAAFVHAGAAPAI